MKGNPDVNEVASHLQKRFSNVDEIECDEVSAPPADSDGDARQNQSFSRERGGFDLSDDGLALALGKAGGWDRDAKHVKMWGRWLFWTGTRWKVDETSEAPSRVRDFLRDRAEDLMAWADRKAGAGAEADRKRLIDWAKRQVVVLGSISKARAVREMAQSNDATRAHPDDFDRDLMLLGTPGGTVDLRTGQLREAAREDLITKQTAVAPVELWDAQDDGGPVRWLQFLAEVFEGDQEIIDFMQRAAGYALTGRTDEHKMLFLYGTGRNGKSTFIETLSWLFGEYARMAPAETFLSSQHAQHSTDIAGLAGARLVMSSELPVAKTWDEAVIKKLTGGDELSARYMRQDFFEFYPQLTLMIAGNHQPSFRGVDEAIRARVILVPFTVFFPPEKRQKNLRETLQAEGPQILRWCIEGAKMWQRRGLDVPERLMQASQDYFDAEDIVGQFLEAEAERVVGHFEKSADIHKRFTQWIEDQGLSAWAQTTLMKDLRGRGFIDAKSGSHRGLKGLKLLVL